MEYRDNEVEKCQCYPGNGVEWVVGQDNSIIELECKVCPYTRWKRWARDAVDEPLS
jgi:hypothetical protein